jgi:hypothetical protein
MWILPKNLQLSSGAPDTAGFISDLNEQSQICASSLMVRSKASPARTWSQKWKRDSWTQHLSGRILRPSHARTFATEWTSLWPVIPASHFPQPESDSAQKTLATSGHTSPDQYELFDLDYASLKMSKATSPSDSERSLESWNQLVTKRRGEYSLRLKSAHRTSGSGSSSWPTIRASEYKDTGPIGSKSHDHMLGKGYLCAVVTQDAWQTPTTNMDMVRSEEGVQKRIAFRASIGRKSIPDGNLGEQMQRLHGQAAPANPSTDGSRQGLSWMTPRACEAQNPPMGVDKRHHGLTHQVTKQWLTPKVPSGGGQATRTTDGGGLRKLEDQTEAKATGKLNPRWVETLMGLPVGWVMPSCKSPVTIEPTNCDSSATESCLQQPSELFAF